MVNIFVINSEVIDIDNLMTLKDLKEYLHISDKTATKLLKVKGFPAFKIGRSYYIPETELSVWISSQTKNNTKILI